MLALGVCTDESLAGFLRELGEPCDRTAIVKWRSGERKAPLGLLDLILSHVDRPAAVLDLWARDHGLRVVPDIDPADGRTLSDRSAQVVEILAEVMKAVREGRLDRVADHAAELAHVASDIQAQARRAA